MPVTLAELAQRFDCEVRGHGDTPIDSVATLEHAGPRSIAFVVSRTYLKRLSTTAAGAVILTPDDSALYSGNVLITPNPHACFARIAAFLHPEAEFTPGVHPSAVVESGAHIAASAYVGALAVVEAGADIGDGVYIGPGCCIGARTRIGADSRLLARVVVAHDCVLGVRVVVQPGAVIGGDGFGYARERERWIKVPQLGRVILGDDVEVGANTTIDRGALEDTIVGNGVKLDNLIQIAHNVQIGEHTAMAACVGVAGSARIGKRCAIGGRANIAGHLEITDDVQIAATSFVTGSISQPGMYSSGIPVEPAELWRKNVARLRQLDELVRKMKRIENKIEKLIEGDQIE